MAHRWIEIVIGKLVTDAALRDAFVTAPHDTLLELVDQGMHLSRAEIAALIAIDPRLWASAAEHIDLAPLTAHVENE